MDPTSALMSAGSIPPLGEETSQPSFSMKPAPSSFMQDLARQLQKSAAEEYRARETVFRAMGNALPGTTYEQSIIQERNYAAAAQQLEELAREEAEKGATSEPPAPQTQEEQEVIDRLNDGTLCDEETFTQLDDLLMRGLSQEAFDGKFMALMSKRVKEKREGSASSQATPSLSPPSEAAEPSGPSYIQENPLFASLKENRAESK